MPSTGGSFSFELDYKESTEDTDEKRLNQVIATVKLTDAIFLNFSVFFTSPNYPNSYPGRAYYVWLIDGGVLHKLKLVVDSVDLEGCCDELTVYDGKNRSGQVLKSVSGMDQPGFNVSSQSNALFILFRSDCTVGGRGFSATVSTTLDPLGVAVTTTLPPTTTTTTTTVPTTTTLATTTPIVWRDLPMNAKLECATGLHDPKLTYLLATGTKQVIKSPNYPADYDDNTCMEWVINAKNFADHVVKLSVNNVSVEYYHYDLAKKEYRGDPVEIDDGLTGRKFVDFNCDLHHATCIGVDVYGPQRDASGGGLLIRFRTDDRFTSRGFSFEFSEVRITDKPAIIGESPRACVRVLILQFERPAIEC